MSLPPQGGDLLMRHLASPFVVGVGSRFSGQLIAFGSIVIASHYLDLAAFGTYALAWAVTVICSSFVFSGPYQALLRNPEFVQNRDTFFWLMAAVGAAGLCLMLIAGALSGGPSGPLGWAFMALAPIPLLQAPAAWLESQLVRDKRVRSASSYVVVAESLGFVVLVLLLRSGLGIGALIAARYAATLAALVMTAALARRMPRVSFRRAAIPEIRAAVLPLWSTTALGMFSNYGADLILGAFLNPTAVGTYRSGARIAGTVSDLLLQPLLMLSWSRFSRLEKEGQSAGIRGAWLENMTLAATLFWPVMASVALLSDELVTVVFGPAWGAAAPVVAVLAVARSLRFFSVLLEPTLICSGRAALQQRIRLVSALLLLGFLLAFGRYGQIHAAGAQALVGLSVAVMSLAAAMSVLRLGYADLARTFLPGLSLAAVCLGAIVATAPLRAALDPVTGLLTSVVLLAAIWLAGTALGLRSGRLVLPSP